MQEIQKVEEELICIKKRWEECYDTYISSKKEYDVKTSILKNLYIKRSEERKRKEREDFEKDKEILKGYKDTNSKNFKKINKIKRSVCIDNLDRCGYEILSISPKTSMKDLREFCRKNKIRGFTKMDKQSIIKSLLQI